MKVEFWKDDTQQDALCTYTFQGWIAHFGTTSGGGANHTLALSLRPALDPKQYIHVKLGN